MGFFRLGISECLVLLVVIFVLFILLALVARIFGPRREGGRSGR